MATDAMHGEAPTRREYVRASGAVLGAGLLAGCARQSPEPAGDGSRTSGTTGAGDGSYTASMAPMGDVEFDGVLEDAFVVFPQYADMAVALEHGDAVNAVYVPEMSGKTMNNYFARLDGVAFDWIGLSDPLSDGLGKEELYALDSDVHFLDPAYAASRESWTASDIREIRENVAPWFGNFYSGTRAQPPERYRDAYEYYDLWTLFERVAAVFRERERYRELRAVHDEMLAHIEANLPPESERPTASASPSATGITTRTTSTSPGTGWRTRAR